MSSTTSFKPCPSLPWWLANSLPRPYDQFGRLAHGRGYDNEWFDLRDPKPGTTGVLIPNENVVTFIPTAALRHVSKYFAAKLPDDPNQTQLPTTFVKLTDTTAQALDTFALWTYSQACTNPNDQRTLDNDAYVLTNDNNFYSTKHSVLGWCWKLGIQLNCVAFCNWVLSCTFTTVGDDYQGIMLRLGDMIEMQGLNDTPLVAHLIEWLACTCDEGAVKKWKEDPVLANAGPELLDQFHVALWKDRHFKEYHPAQQVCARYHDHQSDEERRMCVDYKDNTPRVDDRLLRMLSQWTGHSHVQSSN